MSDSDSLSGDQIQGEANTPERRFSADIPADFEDNSREDLFVHRGDQEEIEEGEPVSQRSDIANASEDLSESQVPNELSLVQELSDEAEESLIEEETAVVLQDSAIGGDPNDSIGSHQSPAIGQNTLICQSKSTLVVQNQTNLETNYPITAKYSKLLEELEVKSRLSDVTAAPPVELSSAEDQSDFPVASRLASLAWDSDIHQYSDTEPAQKNTSTQNSQHSEETFGANSSTDSQTIVPKQEQETKEVDQNRPKMPTLAKFEDTSETESEPVDLQNDQSESENAPNERSEIRNDKALAEKPANKNSLKISISSEVMDCTIQADNLPMKLSQSSEKNLSSKVTERRAPRVPQVVKQKTPSSRDFSVSESNEIFRARPSKDRRNEQVITGGLNKAPSLKNRSSESLGRESKRKSKSRERDPLNFPRIPDLHLPGLTSDEEKPQKPRLRRAGSLSSSESSWKQTRRSCDHGHHFDHREVHACCLPPPPAYNFTPRIQQVKREVTRRSTSVDDSHVYRPKPRTRIPSVTSSSANERSRADISSDQRPRHSSSSNHRSRDNLSSSHRSRDDLSSSHRSRDNLSNQQLREDFLSNQRSRINFSSNQRSRHASNYESDTESIASSRIPRFIGKTKGLRDHSLTDDEFSRPVSRCSIDHPPRARYNHSPLTNSTPVTPATDWAKNLGERKGKAGFLNHWAVGFIIGVLAAAAFKYILCPGTDAAIQYMQSLQEQQHEDDDVQDTQL